MKTTILELKGVRKTYRIKGSFLDKAVRELVALNKMSLSLFQGEIFGLVGESGSGKTTMGRLIVRLEAPRKGRIYFEGKEVSGLKGRARKDFARNVQMIFQDPYQSLNPQLSIFDMVSEPLIIHRMGNKGERKKLVREVLKSVGLSPSDDFFYRYPHQLSGGQRQRVAIARAMVLKPKFVVADEPTSMLDASISAQIFNILLGMQEKTGSTLLFITHSLAAARYLCDRIAVIYRGNLMEMGHAEDVIQNPGHPYTQALIDALPGFVHKEDTKDYGTLLSEDRKIPNHNGCSFFARCGKAHEAKCGSEMPPLREVGDSHFIACYYC